MKNITCLSCANWTTEKCDTCLSDSFHYSKPIEISFQNYVQTWITPKQYEQRTGHSWPKEAAVYFKCVMENDSIEEKLDGEWYAERFFERITEGFPIVCAIGLNAPPVDWLPDGWV